MATDINFSSQMNEMIGNFDNLIDHEIDLESHFQISDWRFWEQSRIQPQKEDIQEISKLSDNTTPTTTFIQPLYPLDVSNHDRRGVSEANLEQGIYNYNYERNSNNLNYFEHHTNLVFSNCSSDSSIKKLNESTSFLSEPANKQPSPPTGDSLIKRLLLNSNCTKSDTKANESNYANNLDSVKKEADIKEISEENNKCEVCFAKAGKHNYYGGNVCTSCRGFFRRSVQSKQYPLFVCNLSGNNNLPINKIDVESYKNQEYNVTSKLCAIDSKSRKSCKHCRFLRCISRGMRPGWVLSDEDRMRRLMQRNRKQQRQQQICVKRQIILHFTQEERQLVEQLKSLIFAEAYSAYYETFGEDIEIFRSYVNAIYYRQPIKYRVIKKIENIDKRAMIEKGFHLLDTILDVSKIHSNLKQALVKHNNVALFGFYWAVFCEACDMEEFMSEFMSYGLTHRNGPGVESLLEEMGKLNLRDKKSAWAYDMIYFSPWAPCADIEERHQKLTKRICMWPRMKSDGENKIDRSQLAILTMILLLSQDGIDIDASFENLIHLKAAEENQTKFVMMLHRYLKDKHQDDDEVVNAALANGLMIVSQAKELHEMHSLMLPI